MEVKPNLGCGLHKSIGTRWKGDDLSDFTVVVDGTSFQCHRFILSACSDFFQALFRSQMRECQENQAELQGMTASTFDVIIKSVYRGVDGLTKDNVLDVWSATEQLQIRYLTEECENFAINNVSVDDCFNILRHSRLYSAEKVFTNILMFISKHFEQLSKMENLLQLSFAEFYRVIESDYLTASSEDVVVETVLKWMDYTHFHSSENDRTGSLSENLINLDYDEVIQGLCQKVCQNVRLNDIVKDQSQWKDRKQHMFTLISTCRLYLISPSCLDNLLYSPTLVSCQKSLNLVSDAMMYKLCVGHRHDPWPEPAVHRVTSNMKHVMVFLSNNKFMAYNLNTGYVYNFADLPKDYCSDPTFIVFDNVLYLGYVNNQFQSKFRMLAENKSWEIVNDIEWTHRSSFKFLALDNCIIYLAGSCLYFCRYLSGHSRTWCLWSDLNSATTEEDDEEDLNISQDLKSVDLVILFQKYILVFYTLRYNPVSVLCYNINTMETDATLSSMDGTCQGMVSFTHHGDVFLLQRNGSLWKILSTDIDLVDFELVSKLWDGDVDLKGCVVYRKELFVFHQKSYPIVPTVTEINLGSVTDHLIKIKMVAVNSESSCLPMVLPQSWLIVEDSK